MITSQAVGKVLTAGATEESLVKGSRAKVQVHLREASGDGVTHQG